MIYCDKCNNTGSTTKEGYLDCIAPGCNAAENRADFDKWLLREGYGQSGKKEWSIYQHAQQHAPEATVKESLNVGELPALPAHPAAVNNIRWTELEEDAIRAYGRACIAAARPAIWYEGCDTALAREAKATPAVDLSGLKAEVPDHLRGTPNGNHYRDGYNDCLHDVRALPAAAPMAPAGPNTEQLDPNQVQTIRERLTNAQPRSASPICPLTQAQIDHIGEQWDGCTYPRNYQMIDIGASIRAELAKIGGVK